MMTMKTCEKKIKKFDTLIDYIICSELFSDEDE